MLEAIAEMLDTLVRLIAPWLPGLRGGGVARWARQPLTQFSSSVLPRAIVVQGFGLELVLDRELSSR